MTQRYVIDTSHSTVGFSVRHMMITNVRGSFQKFSGEVEYDAAAPAATKISGVIDIASINTHDEKRDGHLRSPDFFDAEKNPSMTFTSKSVAKKGDGLEVTGDLTIRGVTKEVALHVEDITGEHADPWGNKRIGASAKAKIKRSEFGITWNAALEAGGVLVGDDINIAIEVSLIKQA